MNSDNMRNTDIIYYFKPKGEYTELRYFEKPDSYGQHSGEVTSGYFRKSDLRQDGDLEWAGHELVYKDYSEADYHASVMICD